MPLLFLVLGTAFGLVLSRAGATDYDFIQRMFLFEDIQLYGIIGTAVAVLAPGLWLLQRHGRTVAGTPLRLAVKPRHGGSLLGGALFGVGWAVTGMCPGPIFVNLGEGKLYAVAALAGAICGTWLFGKAWPVLDARLGLRVDAEAPESTREAA